MGFERIKKFRSGLAVVLACLFLTGCTAIPDQSAKSRMSYFIGVDVSGSFRDTPYFEDSLEFLAYYIYGHINGLGKLKKPKSLFVGAVGGNYADDPQVFHSIYDFENKSPLDIHNGLKNWFVKKDHLTDFNTFFQSIAQLVKKRNLTLSPITVLILSDGIPEGIDVKKGEAGRASYSKIDLTPLDYLARNITLRIIYPPAKVAKNWEEYVSRKRVRLWTVADEVMKGWRSQLIEGELLESQTKLLEWINYNVDYRVRVKKI
ncbi:MAG: hypothetical protein ABII74_05315 [Elusimicrobiota bacterium]